MSSTSILPRAPRWRTRAATALAMVGALVSSSGVVLMATASPAQAGPPAPHKVFVCKYVGTSGVDEVLQPSENNPISVDTHALKGVGFTAQHPSTAQFPFSFSDQQGRSVAIAWDETQGDGQSGEPPLGCPPPRGPVEIDPPQQPPVEDPCGPRNIRFKLPDDTDRLDWTLQNNGNVTVAPKPGFTFKGTSQLLTFTLPADSGEACPDEDDEIDVPAQPDVLDPCGPANNAFEARQDTAELDWQLLGNGDLTVKPQDGFVFEGDSQRVTFTLPEDTNEVCPQVDREIAVPASPGVLDPCGPANNAFEARQDTAELDWQLLGNGDLTVTPKTGFVFAGASQLVTFALPADSGRGCPTPTILGVQEIAPTVSFTDPDCAGRDAAWSGTFEDVVDYAVSGDVAPGGSVVVTASVKPSLAGSYGFPVGFDPTSEHSFPSQASLDCVEILGVEKTKAPKPPRAPVALGTTAAVPTAVAAGLGSLPVAGPVPGDLLGRTLTAAGIALLLAAGWLAMGRRERGAREA